MHIQIIELTSLKATLSDRLILMWVLRLGRCPASGAENILEKEVENIKSGDEKVCTEYVSGHSMAVTAMSSQKQLPT